MCHRKPELSNRLIQQDWLKNKEILSIHHSNRGLKYIKVPDFFNVRTKIIKTKNPKMIFGFLII